MPLQKIILKSPELAFVRSRLDGELHVRDRRKPVSLYRRAGSEVVCGRQMTQVDGEVVEEREAARIDCYECYRMMFFGYPESEVEIVREKV